MNVANLLTAESWFQVLQTSMHSQTAVMTLAPGQASGPHPEAHEHSEQTLLVVTGSVMGEIEQERSMLHAGDVVVIPPGRKHRFHNEGREPVVTFSVYVPPEYAPDDKG